MAISHVTSGEIVDVRAFGSELASHRTSALFKTSTLEVLRLVLLAGKSMPPHKVAGEITLQCLEGLVELTVEGQVQKLAMGQLVFLSGGVMHSLIAIEDSSVLVTILLHA